MFYPDTLDILFVTGAFLFQVFLTGHFALRRWHFDTALRYGPVVYALGVPAAMFSLVLLLTGRPWTFWLGGFLYLTWAVFGYSVEYVLKIEWRLNRRWPIFIPYICLYLATVMFYWFPLALIFKPLWYCYGVLFAFGTFLNISSHKPVRSTP